jgi:hypothetical protein
VTSSVDVPKPYDVVLGGNNPITIINNSPEEQTINKTATKQRNALSSGFSLLFKLLGWIIKTTLIIFLAAITASFVLVLVCAVGSIAIGVISLVVLFCYTLTEGIPFGFFGLMFFIGLISLGLKNAFQN